MLNQFAVEIPTLPVDQCHSHLIQFSGGMLSRSIGMPSHREAPPSMWDTHGKSGNVFANPAGSSSAPCPQELNPWSSGISEQINSSQAGKSENQTKVFMRWKNREFKVYESMNFREED